MVFFMDQSREYGQQDFNLPHDVVQLPSQGIFYKNKKKSVKVGYLTAQDENIILSSGSGSKGIIYTLLNNKIYEPDVRPEDLLDSDIEAILIFLRNTAFGSEYTFKVKDPSTDKFFEKTISLDELNIKKPTHNPNNEGHFEFNLPRTNSTVVCRLLTMGDTEELRKMEEEYPSGMVAPIITNRLQKQIVSVDGSTDGETIGKFIQKLPIMDSKFIRKTLTECEPRLDLDRVIIAPSGEEVNVKITFGVEFFRPFF